MLYEERSPHQHHTIEGSMNVKDIVGPARSSPLRWCIYEAGWRSATPRFQPVPKPLPEGQDRLGPNQQVSTVLDITNEHGPNRPTLRAIAALSR